MCQKVAPSPLAIWYLRVEDIFWWLHSHCFYFCWVNLCMMCAHMVHLTIFLLLEYSQTTHPPTHPVVRLYDLNYVSQFLHISFSQVYCSCILLHPVSMCCLTRIPPIVLQFWKLWYCFIVWSLIHWYVHVLLRMVCWKSGQDLMLDVCYQN